MGERGALSVASFTWSGSDLDPVGLYTMLEGLAKIGHDSYELGDAQPVPVELGGESGYHFIVEADGRRHDRTTYALLVTADGRELYEQVRGGFSFLD